MKESEIDKVLSSLDDLKRQSAPEGFSERLFKKLDKEKKVTLPWYFQMKYGMAAMIALLIVNGYILLKSDLVQTREELTIETLADEWYTEFDLIVYDYEIE